MARIRYLKPDFFNDSDIGKLSPLARLLFEGLWCHADRNGRLPDRPEELKLKILPYDDVDVDELLAELAAPKSAGHGSFIERYTALGKGYIQVHNFKEHQRPHGQEKELYPPPPDIQTEELATDPVKTGQNATKPVQTGELATDPVKTGQNATKPVQTLLAGKKPEGIGIGIGTGTGTGIGTGTGTGDARAPTRSPPNRESEFAVWWDSERKRIAYSAAFRETQLALAPDVPPDVFLTTLENLSLWCADPNNAGKLRWLEELPEERWPVWVTGKLRRDFAQWRVNGPGTARSRGSPGARPFDQMQRDDDAQRLEEAREQDRINREKGLVDAEGRRIRKEK